jgi:hypothetical protein
MKTVATLLSVAVMVIASLMTSSVVLAEEEEGFVTRAIKVLEFDIAENGKRFVFDETPVHEDMNPPQPAYGNPFVTEGYIYPLKTLNGSNGVKPDGSPEFPKKVIGKWTCRGWFIGDGVKTTTGPWVITTQLYDLGDQHTLISEGYEIADLNVEVLRGITGGTGPFMQARGQAAQTLLGFNTTGGVNLRFKIVVKGFNPSAM